MGNVIGVDRGRIYTATGVRRGPWLVRGFLSFSDIILYCSTVFRFDG
jgi:hypothetical protein